MVKKFTIFGERCSGTNYLEKILTTNFDLEITWQYGWKHFFGFSEINESDDIIIVGIVRNPIDWMNSLYNQPFHLHDSLKENPNSFLQKEFYSIYDDPNNHKYFGEEIAEDKNMLTRNKYKNIFEARSIKCRYLLDVVPSKTENYILIKYEDLLEDYVKVLDKLQKKFNLETKEEPYKNIQTYRGDNEIKFQIKKYDYLDKKMILENLDMELEKRLEYNL